MRTADPPASSDAEAPVCQYCGYRSGHTADCHVRMLRRPTRPTDAEIRADIQRWGRPSYYMARGSIPVWTCYKVDVWYKVRFPPRTNDYYWEIAETYWRRRCFLNDIWEDEDHPPTAGLIERVVLSVELYEWNYADREWTRKDYI